MTPEVCPNCGDLVPPKARACPGCGADEDTGWNDRATTQRIGASDPDDFDAGEFAENEFSPPRARRLPLAWTLMAIAALASLVWMVLR